MIWYLLLNPDKYLYERIDLKGQKKTWESYIQFSHVQMRS